MRNRLTGRAKRELAGARAWYRGTGVTRRFGTRVREALARVGRAPTSFEIVDPVSGLRRCPILSFPYDLLFIAGDDEVEVLSVWHHHRDPADRPY